MFLLPAFVIYIYFEHPSISFYIVSFIMTILIPIIPTVISSILGYLVKLVSSKFKSKKIIQTILSSIIFMGIFFLSFNLNNFIKENNIDIIDIRFNSSCSIYGEEQIYCFSALIMYESNNKE